MKKTLENSPEKFFENNLGISIIANDVEMLSSSKYKLHFKSGTGILNGGHTQRAILDSAENIDISRATIRLTVRVKDYDAKRIAEIASAQNSCSAVKEYSLAEKKGLFADIKKQMDANFEKHIIWYEGKEVAGNIGLEATDLIAMLNVFNIELYSSKYSDSTISSTDQPTTSASGKGSAFKKWETEENLHSFKTIYPLVNDILQLYEYILVNCTDGTGLTRLSTLVTKIDGKGKPLIFNEGQTYHYNVPKQLIFPLLAAFRANVYYDQANEKIGWFMDNEVLFDTYKKELITLVSKACKEKSNNVNEIGKSPLTWLAIYQSLNNHIDTTQQYKSYSIPK